jgi:hypothetical protein
MGRHLLQSAPLFDQAKLLADQPLLQLVLRATTPRKDTQSEVQQEQTQEQVNDSLESREHACQAHPTMVQTHTASSSAGRSRQDAYFFLGQRRHVSRVLLGSQPVGLLALHAGRLCATTDATTASSVNLDRPVRMARKSANRAARAITEQGESHRLQHRAWREMPTTEEAERQ